MAHEDHEQEQELELWTPADYRIEVKGHLGEHWSGRLGGMHIAVRKDADHDQTVVTTLIGRLKDQAELTGVLNSLYELHLPILSVQNLNIKPVAPKSIAQTATRSNAQVGNGTEE